MHFHKFLLPIFSHDSLYVAVKLKHHSFIFANHYLATLLISNSYCYGKLSVRPSARDVEVS